MTLPKLTVDVCPDANGHFTIRPADGSPNGDTEADPIATVYDADMALLIVEACNSISKK